MVVKFSMLVVHVDASAWPCPPRVRATTSKRPVLKKEGGSIVQSSSKVPPSVKRGFGPSARLRKKCDIERCQKLGAKLHAKHFLLLVYPSGTGESRLAVAVTTKLEKRSVVRNRIKRRIREVFRAARARFTSAIDIVVVARRDVQSCEFSDYQREILGALRAKGYLHGEGDKL